MIDIDTHKVVDILNSRDYKEVKEWLEEYPNIEIVSRDGSSTYAKAIKDAHDKAIQISDRFHLLKNLTDYCKDTIKRTIKHVVEVEVPIANPLNSKNVTEIKEKYKYKTKWDLILSVKNMRKDGYTINQICEVLGIGNKSVIKYYKMDECLKEKYDKNPANEVKQEDKRRMKEELINELKLLKSNGHTIRAIAREQNLSRSTVKKYLKSEGNFVHAILGRTFKSKLDGYKMEIANYLRMGKSSVDILKIIQEAGYSGSDTLVRHFLSKLRKQDNSVQNIEKEKIARSSLISLLYKDKDKIKSITKEQLYKVINIYPGLTSIYEIVKEFKQLLFSKNPYMLDPWIASAKKLNIAEINSFITGLTRDLQAVKNSIAYKYSNGLAEGTVNKIKVIKRIMYGRCSFELLRRKLILHNIN